MLRSVFRSKWKERLHPSVKKQLEELLEKTFLDLRLKRIEELFSKKRKKPLEEELKLL